MTTTCHRHYDYLSWSLPSLLYQCGDDDNDDDNKGHCSANDNNHYNSGGDHGGNSGDKSHNDDNDGLLEIFNNVIIEIFYRFD